MLDCLLPLDISCDFGHCSMLCIEHKEKTFSPRCNHASSVVAILKSTNWMQDFVLQCVCHLWFLFTLPMDGWMIRKSIAEIS